MTRARDQRADLLPLEVEVQRLEVTDGEKLRKQKDEKEGELAA